MSDLLSIDELRGFVGVAPGDADALLMSIADAVEEQFLADANRRERPFQDVQTARVERHDARRSPELYLAYPIETLTSVVLGLDPATPDETLDIADPTVLQWTPGRRRLVRVDGGVFGPYPSIIPPRWPGIFPPLVPGAPPQAPNYVHVTYDAQADLPNLAKLAIERAVAMIYRQLGSEDVTDERASTYSRTMAKVYTDDLIWTRAVNACWEPRV